MAFTSDCEIRGLSRKLAMVTKLSSLDRLLKTVRSVN
jgi:hypothetical protein